MVHSLFSFFLDEVNPKIVAFKYEFKKTEVHELLYYRYEKIGLHLVNFVAQELAYHDAGSNTSLEVDKFKQEAVELVINEEIEIQMEGRDYGDTFTKNVMNNSKKQPQTSEKRPTILKKKKYEKKEYDKNKVTSPKIKAKVMYTIIGAICMDCKQTNADTDFEDAKKIVKKLYNAKLNRSQSTCEGVDPPQSGIPSTSGRSLTSERTATRKRRGGTQSTTTIPPKVARQK